MEERKVQEGGAEGTSEGESTSPPGTTAPQNYLTREQAEQLIRDSVEEASRHFQSSADRRVGELERQLREQSPREEDYDDDLLSAQAGYFQQQPQYTQDPTTGQWYLAPQDPYAAQRAEVERRRQARARRDREQYRRDLDEVRGRQEEQLWIDQMLAGAGMTRADINPYDYSRQEFATEIAKRKAAKAEAQMERKIDAEVQKRMAEVDQKRQELLQQQIDSGAIDQFTGGPAAARPSGDVVEQLTALNDAFRLGKIDTATFEKRAKELRRAL